MAVKMTREMALSICEKIREENRARPSDPQAQQCRKCEACSSSSPIKSHADGAGRPCCLVRQRCARLLAMPA